jgi:alpha,alpha-trehalose phosphorylase
MRDHDGTLTLAPRFPTRLERLAFRLLFRETRLKVDVSKSRATDTILDGPPLQIGHHGKPITIAPNQPVSEEIPPPAKHRSNVSSSPVSPVIEGGCKGYAQEIRVMN